MVRSSAHLGPGAVAGHRRPRPQSRAPRLRSDLFARGCIWRVCPAFLEALARHTVLLRGLALVLGGGRLLGGSGVLGREEWPGQPVRRGWRWSGLAPADAALERMAVADHPARFHLVRCVRRSLRAPDSDRWGSGLLRGVVHLCGSAVAGRLDQCAWKVLPIFPHGGGWTVLRSRFWWDRVRTAAHRCSPREDGRHGLGCWYRVHRAGDSRVAAGDQPGRRIGRLPSVPESPGEGACRAWTGFWSPLPRTGAHVRAHARLLLVVRHVPARTVALGQRMALGNVGGVHPAAPAGPVRPARHLAPAHRTGRSPAP